MNLRCIYCQTPFTLARTEMLGAIITMNEKHQSHYDAHCPRCRRANSISRQRMELFFPNWQDAAKELASAPTAKEEVPAGAFLKTEPIAKPAKVVAEKKAAPKAKKPAEKKPTAAAKKPAAKKTTTKASEAKPKKK
jgi:phage FluMu protein Com